jgi:hypothetical protein
MFFIRKFMRAHLYATHLASFLLALCLAFCLSDPHLDGDRMMVMGDGCMCARLSCRKTRGEEKYEI